MNRSWRERCHVRAGGPRPTVVIGTALLLMTGTAFAQGGPYERQRIDNAAADRGRAIYARHCINCHGSTAKGTDRGPDLIRSTVVLRDRLGNGIGPAIRPSAAHQATLTQAEIVDLSHFIHQRVEAVASNRNPRAPLPVLTGDPEAGRAYFNGAGRCSSCHSAAGDLAGIATRIPDAANLQQRFLFPTLRPSTSLGAALSPVEGRGLSASQPPTIWAALVSTRSQLLMNRSRFM